MTGRKRHMVRDGDGSVTMRRRRDDVPQVEINRSEKAAFQDGKKVGGLVPLKPRRPLGAG